MLLSEVCEEGVKGLFSSLLNAICCVALSS